MASNGWHTAAPYRITGNVFAIQLLHTLIIFLKIIYVRKKLVVYSSGEIIEKVTPLLVVICRLKSECLQVKTKTVKRQRHTPYPCVILGIKYIFPHHAATKEPPILLRVREGSFK